MVVTDRRRRLYEQVFQKPFPESYANHYSRRVTPTRADNTEESSLADIMDEDIGNQESTPELMSEQRRRRIYEMQFGRPYPKLNKKKKKFQFYEHTLNTSSASPPSREDDFNRAWMTPDTLSSSTSFPETPLEPRKLWTSQISSSQEDDDDDDEDVIMMKENCPPPPTSLQDEDMRSTPRRSTTPSERRLFTPLRSTRQTRDVIMKVTPPNSISPVISDTGNISPLTSPIRGIPNLESHQTLHQFVSQSENHILKLYIDDYQVSTFDPIVESLFSNSSLRTLAVCRGSDPALGNYRTRLEIKAFLEAMRCLPHLETLMMLNFRTDILNDLAVAFQSHATLTKVQLHFAEGTLTPLLLEALASAPKLVQVQLEVNESFEVDRLLHSSSLRMLRVMSENFMFSRRHVRSLADRLATNTTLVALDLEPSLNLESFVALMQALRSNTTLQSLRVSFCGTHQDCQTAVLELASLLRVNSTLRQVVNHSHGAIVSMSIQGTESMECLRRALHKNYSLRRFQFFQEDPTFCVAKEAILKRNKNYKNSSSHQSLFASWFSGSLFSPCGGIQL
jgi:hypothetical protein